MENNDSFLWPQGKRAAVSISFDDARPSQADRGLPILDEHGVKGTFYVIPAPVKHRLEIWQAAQKGGHEIGNHTVSHPCSANFTFTRANALEDYTLARIEGEMQTADDAIWQDFGIKPQTYAFPCGQKFVGRGEQLQSYVPVVAKRFLAGRGFRDEAPNSPLHCDLAQLLGIDADTDDLDDILRYIKAASETGGWVILAAHDVGDPARQTISEKVLHALCRYCQAEENGIWIDTVAAIAAHVAQNR